MTTAEAWSDPHDQHLTNKKRQELVEVRQELAPVERNMARARDDAQFASISADFDKLKRAESVKLNEIAEIERRSFNRCSIDDQITAALAQFSKLPELAADPENLPAVTQLFKRNNAQLYLRFEPQKKKKRMENRIAGGILTWGNKAPPIQKYQGPTSRQYLKRNVEAGEAPMNRHIAANRDENEFVTDGEGLLGNVSRGDWI